MEKVAETYRLQRRGTTWYYLRRVPSELVPIIGKPVIKLSLKTASRSEAKKLRTIKDLEWDARFEQARVGSPKQTGTKPRSSDELTQERLVRYIRKLVDTEDGDASKAFLAQPPDSLDQLQEIRGEAEWVLHALSNPDDPDRQVLISAQKQPFLDWAHAGKEAPLPPEFAELVRRALIEIYRRKIDRLDDRHDRAFHDPLFDPEPAPTVAFKELAQTYISEKGVDWALNGVSAKRSDKVRAIVAILQEIVGPETPVSTIDDAIVWKVRSRVARLPSNGTKHYPGVPLEIAIVRAEKDGRKPLSPTTQGFYLDTLRDILKLGVRRKFLLFNPAGDVKPLKKNPLAAGDRRHPFTPAQLKGFFQGAFYQRCAPGADEAYAKGDRDWRFWFPLIMLFSGARPNEIAQLRVTDVRRSSAKVHYLDLMDEGDGTDAIKVKTASSRRRIPIHSELARIGFLDFVAVRRKSGGATARLFPSLKPNKYGNLAWYPVKRFNETFLPAEIKVGDRQALYSIRHCVRDALRRVNAPQEALRAIAGWSPGGKSTSDHYGDPTDPDLYAKWVEGIAYPGLDLSFLHT